MADPEPIAVVSGCFLTNQSVIRDTNQFASGSGHVRCRKCLLSQRLAIVSGPRRNGQILAPGPKFNVDEISPFRVL